MHIFSISSAALLAASLTAAELNVLIYGGGTAAATLAQALKGYEHINLQYYDPNLNLTPTSFRLLGLSPKAWDALDLVSEEASGAINRATWYPEAPSVIEIGTGPDAGKTVLDYEKLENKTHRPEVAVVDPAPFLMEMLNGTDKSRLHPNMTLASIEQDFSGKNGPVQVTFQDGTKVTADVVIADGGMLSPIRPYVLGVEDPTTFPVFMNFLSAVAHVPPEEAKKFLGSPYADASNDHRWERIGNGSWFLDAYLEGFFTCLGSFYTTEDYDLSQFTRPTSVEELTSYFGNFEGGKGMIEVLSKYSGLRLIPEIEHLKPPTYVKGNVAIMGNAAHTMTNFQQLGPGQDLEDGMVLGALLSKAKDRSDIPAALAAYDKVRRPRAHDVAEHGKRLGLLWTGKSEVGIDVDGLRNAFLSWREDMESFDLKAHRQDALDVMERELGLRKGRFEAGWLQGLLGLHQSASSLPDFHEAL